MTKEEEDIRRAMAILRRGTAAIKVVPFVVVALYAICILSYNFTDKDVQILIDTICYVSPFFAIQMFVLSFIFKMCIFHKIECLLPITQVAISVIDSYYPMTEYGATVNICVCASFLFLTVLNGYFTFKCSKP